MILNRNSRENSDLLENGHTQSMSDFVNLQAQIEHRIVGISDGGCPVVEDQPNDADVEQQHMCTLLSTVSYNHEYIGSGYWQRDSRSCQLCGLLKKQIYCDYTKQFWEEVDQRVDETQGCHIKFFAHFLEKLKVKFPREKGLKSKATVNLLKCLLKVDPKDETACVNLKMVMRLTKLFGPIREECERKEGNRDEGTCVLVNQLYRLVRQSAKRSWFVGEMSRDEAETKLLAENVNENTFLVRISGNDGSDGDFALSVRHKDHCHHLKIQGNPKEALSKTPYHANLKFAGRNFRSLLDAVNYIVRKRDIDLENEEQGECKSVSCFRVYPWSPLNIVISGYERAKY